MRPKQKITRTNFADSFTRRNPYVCSLVPSFSPEHGRPYPLIDPFVRARCRERNSHSVSLEAAYVRQGGRISDLPVRRFGSIPDARWDLGHRPSRG
jgi:hypothetical protein